MHYYIVTCLEKNGPVVRLEVILVHPDIETFGTERYFAWKLLSDFVSPDDDGDDVELARKYITRVEVGPLMHGSVTSQEHGWFSVKREFEDEDDEDAELPTVVYTIEVSDPSLLRPVKVGDSEESVAYVETDKMIFDEPAAASDWRRFECTEGASSKFWEARLHGSMLHVRWGKLGTEGRSQEDDWLSPERAEKAHKKLVAEKVKKGYVEVSAAPAGAPAAVGPETTKAKAGKPKPGKPKPDQAVAPLSPKTYDDLRQVAFELIRGGRHWPEKLIAFLVRWAEEASDEQVMAWLEELSPTENGWFSQAAGRVAVQRALAQQADSARRFAKAGEKGLPTEEKSDLARATLGLMAAWWRLGEKAKAEEAWEKLPADPESYLSSEDLGWVAALGGQLDRFLEIGEIGRMFDYATAEGLLALYADGSEVFCDAVDRCENKDFSRELTEALLRRALKDSRPGAFVELALGHPDILIGSGDGEDCVVLALQALSRTDPSAAVKLSLQVLDQEPFSFGYGAHPHAFAIVAAHAPRLAEQWAKGSEEMGDQENNKRYAYLAALGRTTEVRAALPEISDIDVHLTIACSTPDRALAVKALRAHVAGRNKNPGGDYVSPALLWLCDLGEGALVDELLERELARIEELAPKDRDLACRELCKDAAAVGRVDLARKAYKLPVKGVRYCSIQAMLRGCSAVGDFTGAVDALELFDEDREKLDAVNMSLRVVEEAFVTGPRATQLRSLSQG